MDNDDLDDDYDDLGPEDDEVADSVYWNKTEEVYDAFAEPAPEEIKPLPPLKDHQIEGLRAIRAQREKEPGIPMIAVAPPGAGKSRAMIELTIEELQKPDGRVVIQAHRKALLEQLQKGFRAAGIDFGVLADGYKMDLDKRVQIVSVGTLFARSVRSSKTGRPRATLKLDDEAHQQTGKMQRAITYGYVGPNDSQPGYATEGTTIVGFSGSPVMRASVYQRLVEFGSYSELRACGMHQLVKVFSPDEIDTQGLRADKMGNISEKKLEERAYKIFGSVFDEWKHLNPSAYPALLFAPSVQSSCWFAEEFLRLGVKAAHIDGEKILLPEGKKLVVYPADREHREKLLEMSRTGEVAVVANRFVLREAIDMPWLYHGIFATVFGGLATYLQSVGRLQRYCSNYEYKILQCHGGSYWRHGSPNEDRHWRLGITQTEITRERIDAIVKGERQEGIRCAKCGCWRLSGPVCANEECRHRSTYSVRRVRSISGRLKVMTGRVYTKAKAQQPEAQKLWTSILFSAGKRDQPVSSAVARYAEACAKKGIAVNLPVLKFAPPPPESADWQRSVAKVYPFTVRVKAPKSE